MKPTFSPESTADLQQAIDILERVYRREMGCESNFHMGKLSTAIGELHFVAQSTSTKPLDVQVIVLENAR